MPGAPSLRPPDLELQLDGSERDGMVGFAHDGQEGTTGMVSSVGYVQ